MNLRCHDPIISPNHINLRQKNQKTTIDSLIQSNIRNQQTKKGQIRFFAYPGRIQGVSGRIHVQYARDIDSSTNFTYPCFID